MCKVCSKGFCRFMLSDTYSGWVLAVGLSIETVKIPLSVDDLRHLVDKQRRCIISQEHNRHLVWTGKQWSFPSNDSYPHCDFLFVTHKIRHRQNRFKLTGEFWLEEREDLSFVLGLVSAEWNSGEMTVGLGLEISPDNMIILHIKLHKHSSSCTFSPLRKRNVAWRASLWVCWMGGGGLVDQNKGTALKYTQVYQNETHKAANFICLYPPTYMFETWSLCIKKYVSSLTLASCTTPTIVFVYCTLAQLHHGTVNQV